MFIKQLLGYFNNHRLYNKSTVAGGFVYLLTSKNNYICGVLLLLEEPPFVNIETRLHKAARPTKA